MQSTMNLKPGFKAHACFAGELWTSCRLAAPSSFTRSNGCALDIGVKQGRMVGVRGRATDRVNKGRLGPKGLHG